MAVKIFVRKALCWLNICTHHFASSYFFLSKKKNNKLILHEDSTYRQKKKSGFKNRLIAGWSDRNKFVCRQLSVFSSWDTCTSFVCIYSFRLQFACHEVLATLATLAPTVSWLRQVILTQLCRSLYKAERQWLSLSVWTKKQNNKPHCYSHSVPPEALHLKSVKMVVCVPRSDVYIVFLFFFSSNDKG